MSILTVDQELWDELELPWVYVDRIHVGERRWFDDYEVIFAHDGKFWSFSMGFGSTENQDDESPLEYADSFDAIQVEKRPVTVEKWLPVAPESK